MATIRKRKGDKYWQARFVVPFIGPDGKVCAERVERSTKQRDRGMAKRVAQRLEREALEHAERPDSLPLHVALEAYIAAIEAGGAAEDTLMFYAKKGKHLMRILGETTNVHALGPANASAYVQRRCAEKVPHTERNVSRASAAKELGLLRSTLRWLRTQDRYFRDADWCVPQTLRGAYTPRDRVLTHDEYKKLRAALSKERRDYLAAFVGLGVRDSELYAIQARALMGTRVNVKGTKTQRADRWLPLTPDLAKVMERRAKSPPMFARWGNVRRDLHAACKRAGIAVVSPNDLRRTFASWHAERGTPEMVVVSLMGHASSAMVRRVYARIGSAAQHDAAARFPRLV